MIFTFLFREEVKMFHTPFEEEREQYHIGYKKLANKMIAKLAILEDGENNERRLTVVDAYRDTAKYRCSKARVLDIYDMNDKDKKFTVGHSLVGAYLGGVVKYTVGEIVTPHNGYDENKAQVCGGGIHYFLTEERAIMYDESRSSVELWKDWYENGRLRVEVKEYDDGRYNRIERVYDDAGALREENLYHTGTKIFVGRSYHCFGNKVREVEFEDGVRHGLSRVWFNNGQLHEETVYVDGKAVSSKMWKLNGECIK